MKKLLPMRSLKWLHGDELVSTCEQGTEDKEPEIVSGDPSGFEMQENKIAMKEGK